MLKHITLHCKTLGHIVRYYATLNHTTLNHSFSDGMKDIQNLRFLCYSSCSKEKEKKNSYFYLKFSLVHRYSTHEDVEV